jgi:hypothetical protein
MKAGEKELNQINKMESRLKESNHVITCVFVLRDLIRK